MEGEIYENELLRIKVEEGILHGTYLVEKLDLKGAIQATAFRKQVTKGRSFPALVDVSSFKEVSRETRAYFAKDAGEDLAAIAVLIKNPVSQMMINFFMRFNSPPYPIRFFTSKEDALRWLSPFVSAEYKARHRETVKGELL